MKETPPARPRAGERILLVSLLVLLAAVWLDPPGSFLAEPDEPRYAEIPREMLAAGNLVTPLLNGVPYFEKPPLLYWANAAAFRVFGESPFAARLPTRLAGLGTTLLVLVGVGWLWGRRLGLFAGVLFLVSPLAFTFSRVNLTDGLLTFFFTLTLLAGLATLRRREDGRPTASFSALTGAAAAAAFLTKGLIAVVLPGAILLLWCLFLGRMKSAAALLFGPATPVFVALTVPWFILAERQHPGVLHFFFIHEHLQRFATPIANRPGPIYYFAVVFVAGFLPGLPFFFAGLRPVRRADPEALFFLVWFAVVFLFFSLSRSKLSPYLFPAFPPAAALAARGLSMAPDPGRLWRIAAMISTVVIAAALALSPVRSAIADRHLSVLAALGAACLLAGAWTAQLLRNRSESALGALALGWGGLYLALALIWPRTALAADIPELASRARREASPRGAPIVSYRTYLQGFPWELKSVVPLADATSELEDWFLPESRRAEIFWSAQRFWTAWRSGRPLVVLARLRDLPELRTADPPARVLLARGKHAVVANY